MLIYLADVAEDNEIKPMYFRQWFEFFTEEDELFEVYKTFCSTGSTKLEKIKGRLAVMVKSLCLYLNIEIPEELKDMLTEIEEKFAVKEESAIEPVLLEETPNTEENTKTKDSDEIEVTVTQDSTELEKESSELEELVSETENSNVAEENFDLEDIEQSGSEEKSSDDVICV